VQGTATQASVTLNLVINYQSVFSDEARPAMILTLEHRDVSVESTRILFASTSVLDLFVPNVTSPPAVMMTPSVTVVPSPSVTVLSPVLPDGTSYE